MISSVILLRVFKNGSSPLIDVGACTIPDYENWFVLSDIGFSLSDYTEGSTSSSNNPVDGQPAKDISPASPQSLSVTKAVDQSTVYLMQQAAQDRSTTEDAIADRKAKIIFLENRTSETKNNDVDRLYPTVQFYLGSVKIENWSVDASASSQPTEKFALSFKQFSMVYTGQPAGTSGTKTYGPKSWDETTRKDWSDGSGSWYVK